MGHELQAIGSSPLPSKCTASSRLQPWRMFQGQNLIENTEATDFFVAVSSRSSATMVHNTLPCDRFLPCMLMLLASESVGCLSRWRDASGCSVELSRWCKSAAMTSAGKHAHVPSRGQAWQLAPALTSWHCPKRLQARKITALQIAALVKVLGLQPHLCLLMSGRYPTSTHHHELEQFVWATYHESITQPVRPVIAPRECCQIPAAGNVYRKRLHDQRKWAM